MSNRKKIPLISVVITCYNYAEYVEKAIKSVLSQDYKDIEIIIVNDGSTDTSEAVIKKSIQGIKRVIYHFQENSGSPSARNAGFKKSRGDYLLFLDADDVLEKNFISSSYEQSIIDDADIVYTNVRSFGEYKNLSEKLDFNPDLIYFNNFISVTSLIKREVIATNQFDEKMNRLRADDWDFFLTAIEAGFKPTLNKKTHLNYRIQPKNQSRSKIEVQIKSYRHIYSKHRHKKPGINYALGHFDVVLNGLEISLVENHRIQKELSKVSGELERAQEEIYLIKSSKKWRLIMLYSKAIKRAKKAFKT